MFSKLSTIKETAQNAVGTVVNKKAVRKAVKVLGSPTAINTVKLAVAVVTLFQAIDAIQDSRRSIGFKSPDNKGE
jgi:hypothetical protein